MSTAMPQSSYPSLAAISHCFLTISSFSLLLGTNLAANRFGNCEPAIGICIVAQIYLLLDAVHNWWTDFKGPRHIAQRYIN